MKIPQGETTKLLANRFGNDGKAVERLVDRVTGNKNRSNLMGLAALDCAATALGVQAVDDSSMFIAGTLVRKEAGGYWAIHGSHSSRATRNFTTGHELAHAALVKEWPQLSGNDDADTEEICEMFSAELLMPTAILRTRDSPHMATVAMFASNLGGSAPLSAALRRVADHIKGAAGYIIQPEDDREPVIRDTDGFAHTRYAWQRPYPDWQYGGVRRHDDVIATVTGLGDSNKIDIARLSSGRTLEVVAFNSAKAYLIYPDKT